MQQLPLNPVGIEYLGPWLEIVSFPFVSGIWISDVVTKAPTTFIYRLWCVLLRDRGGSSVVVVFFFFFYSPSKGEKTAAGTQYHTYFQEEMTCSSCTVL